MSADILACLGLEKELEASKIIAIKEIKDCDSTFVSSCVIGNCIRNNKAVLVILTHNSVMHYQYIGLKMNYSLQKSMDSGLVQFYNLGEDFLDKLLENEEFSSDEIFLKIKTKFLSMKEEHESVNIIFEGVSHLFDLQLSIRDVNSVFSAVINMIRDVDNSFLLCHCNVASANDVTHVLANLLAHKSCTVAEVESLQSGWSLDVSGHITINYLQKKFEDQSSISLKGNISHYLFKLFDRGVKLLAPGTV